ncbi:MAG: DNA mismatch repair protein MutS [Acidobacteriota bacterium]
MSDLTPMFRQYRRIKNAHRDCILLFRMGDFYEMFFDDAVRAAPILGITLTKRGKGTAMEAPMCGVPFHAAETYIARLVKRGFRIAVCDQVEDPKQAKGIVRREVTRIVSPGTLSSSDQLEGSVPNYLCSLLQMENSIGATYIDLSTGDFQVAEHQGPDAWERSLTHLAAFSPAEILMPEGAGLRGRLPAAIRESTVVTERPTWEFSLDGGRQEISSQFQLASLAGFGIEDRPLAVRTAGAALRYLRESQKSSLPHLRPPRLIRPGDFLVLDPTTLRNLEIIAAMGTGKRQGSLLGHLDRTCTAGGGRRMRDWLLRPLLDPGAIEARLDGVEELLNLEGPRNRIRNLLRPTGDLERLLARAGLGNASPRDLAAVRETLRKLPAIRDCAGAFKSSLLGDCHRRIDLLEDLHDLLERGVTEDPPASLRDGNVIRSGFSTELDEVRAVRADGKKFLARLERREKERTGIQSLKIRFNKVFGYYIEVSKTKLHLVPGEYTRRQTLVNAERFSLPELKEYEAKVLAAEERITELEAEIFGQLREAIAARSRRITRTADCLAILDTLAGLAESASVHRYVRPVIRKDRKLRIEAGRHPVLEAITDPIGFIPNDTDIDPADSQILLLTGPNMGGKSTYLRQVALITLMGQVGSFVPADRAEIGICDRIFSRVGASDNLLLGHSTFLSEMLEVANILNNATDRSLVLLDEVGRGTSTFDGLSLAWAVVEYLHDNAGLAAKTLFATHYHELTILEETLPRVRNLTMAVREGKDGILFLHKVKRGVSNRSYGIHVAKLAGVPGAVIRRAGEILKRLESRSPRLKPGTGPETDSSARPGDHAQLRLRMEEEREEPLRKALLEVEPEGITPIEAIQILAELREKAEE